MIWLMIQDFKKKTHRLKMEPAELEDTEIGS